MTSLFSSSMRSKKLEGLRYNNGAVSQASEMAKYLLVLRVLIFISSVSRGLCVQETLGSNLDDTQPSMGFVVKPLAAVGILVAVGALVKWYFGGAVCKSKARLKGKTAVVTGANKGIGKATALDFARRGARVILACRDEEKALEAAKDIIRKTQNSQVVVRKLDLASFNSVREFAKKVNENEERLDILVNNAGCGYRFRTTEDGLESVMQVNHLGHFLLTLLLLDKLKKCAPSRIVSVSSVMHRREIWCSNEFSFERLIRKNKKEFNGGEVYSDSKLAQVLFTRELSKRMEGTGVTANALHPGAVNTDIFANFRLLQKPLMKPLVAIFMFFFFKTPEMGAQTTIHCAVAEELAGVSGLYFNNCKPEEPSKLAMNDGVAKKLWEVSEELTGINY